MYSNPSNAELGVYGTWQVPGEERFRVVGLRKEQHMHLGQRRTHTHRRERESNRNGPSGEQKAEGTQPGVQKGQFEKIRVCNKVCQTLSARKARLCVVVIPDEVLTANSRKYPPKRPGGRWLRPPGESHLWSASTVGGLLTAEAEIVF